MALEFTGSNEEILSELRRLRAQRARFELALQVASDELLAWRHVGRIERLDRQIRCRLHALAGRPRCILLTHPPGPGSRRLPSERQTLPGAETSQLEFVREHASTQVQSMVETHVDIGDEAA